MALHAPDGWVQGLAATPELKRALMDDLQIAERLGYVGVIWERLQVGPWSTEIRSQLNQMVGQLGDDARWLGCAALDMVLAEVQRDLGALYRLTWLPDPAVGGTLRHNLVRSTTLVRRLAISTPPPAIRGVPPPAPCVDCWCVWSCAGSRIEEHH